MSVSQLSTHEHRIISMNLFDRHPNWSPSVDSDGPNGVKGATEEDKNRKQGPTGLDEWAWRIYIHGPKESQAHPLYRTPHKIRTQ